MAKKIIAITGSNGFLGKQVVQTLKQLDQDIRKIKRELYCNPTKYTELISELAGADALIHTAGLVLSRTEQNLRPAEVLECNLISDLNIIRAASFLKIKRVVLASSIVSYGQSEDQFLFEENLEKYPLLNSAYEYSLAKRTTNALAKAYNRQYGLNVTSVILPNLYGPNDKFNFNPPPLVPNTIIKIYNAKKNGVTEINAGNNGNQEIQLLHVSDAANAIVACILYDDMLPSILNAGTLEKITIEKFHELVASQVNYTGKINWEIYPDQSTRKSSELNYDLIQNLLKWRPIINLKDGLRSVVDDFIANKGQL